MSFGLFHYKDRNHDGVDDELVGRHGGKYGDIGDFYPLTFGRFMYTFQISVFTVYTYYFI